MVVDDVVVEVGAASVDELSALVRSGARAIDALQARWLVALAEFDRVQGWVLDGAVSAVDWLVTQVGLARGTAFEKLRVAAELRRRPVVRAALLAGRISYSAARAITRALGADAEVDAALVEVAETATVTDVERLVAAYLRFADQDRPPADPGAVRAVRVKPGRDGSTVIEVTLPDADAAELLARLDREAHTAGVAAGEVPTRAAAMVDALMQLARSAAPGEPVAASDRHMVHTVVDHGTASTLDGRPLHPAAAAVIGCDATTVEHHLDGDGHPLYLGRARRTWSTAQRRAVRVRDGGRCRWPGCERRTVDIHHVLAWEDGGSTDVSNAILCCPRHHTLTHAGWFTTGTADTDLTWHHPATGDPIGTTRPDRPMVSRLAALARR